MNNKSIQLSFENIKTRIKPNDIFYTPNELVIKLLKETPYSYDDSLLDPFYGEGAFFNCFQTLSNQNPNNNWLEIEKGKDFFKYNIKHDWIISNPPFSKITEVLKHSLKIADKGIGYIMPSYSLSYSRIKLMNNFGFNIQKTVYFNNPKEWGIGFQMIYVIFVKKEILNNDVQIKTLDLPNNTQKLLSNFHNSYVEGDEEE